MTRVKEQQVSLHTDREYAAMTEDTDTGIGQLLAEISNLGLDNNTYIIVMSDNGGQLGTTVNNPLSEGKSFIFEGGIRVPFIIKGPNIAANTFNTEAIVAYDLFPTIAELSGGTVDLPSNMDGKSLAPLLNGNAFIRTEPIYFHSPHYDNNPRKTPRSAVVDGRYKLMVEYETGQVSLYDLSTDIEESNDISGVESTISKTLFLKLRDHLKIVDASMPSLDSSHANFSGTGPDIDADGLEDVWEFRELLSYIYGPNDDPDNDGLTNLEEYTNGTDPYSSGEIIVEACDPTAIFANELTNAVCFEATENVRKCYTNNIPNHAFGPFGGTNTLEGQDFDYSMCLFPQLGEKTALVADPSFQGCGNGIIFGVSTLGINYSPFARIYWENPNTGEENLDWNVEADFLLNMDLNGGHVNAAHRYHYHNIPQDYFVNDLNIDGTSHSPILGYAADGFPIYYKYLYIDGNNSNSGISTFQSSFALKSGNRPGDGITAPNGTYNGTYIEDYEYIAALSELDECGVRFAKTPEYPNGTYYYVLTDNWPYIPRCLRGEFVDNSFRLGQNCPESTAFDDCGDMITSIENINELNFEITIYPNPAKAHFSIKLAGNISAYDIKSVTIYGLDAKEVYYAEKLDAAINLEGIPKGTYFIQLDFERNQITKKIIIQ